MSDRPLCIVCCAHPAPEWRWIGGTVEARLRLWLSGPTVVRDSHSVLMQVQNEAVLVMTVPGPVPVADLRDDAVQRAAWPGLHEAARKWRSHFIVSATDGIVRPAERRIAAENTTLIAAALVGVARGDAVGWAPTQVYHPAGAFVDRVAVNPLHPDNLIACEWSTAEHDGGLAVTAHTQGLAVFGLPEIDHAPSDEDRRIVRQRIAAIAAHVLARGPLFHPGETVGPDVQTQARVELVRAEGGETRIRIAPIRQMVSHAA